MTLYVTRHGETMYNQEKRFTGRIDAPLNKIGLAQAEQLSRKFQDINLDCIISSGMQCALQTAKCIARNKQLPVEIMGGFEERNVGKFEGLTLDEAKHMCKCENVMDYLTMIDESSWGIEPIAAIEKRVLTSLNIIFENHQKHSYQDGLTLQVIFHYTMGN